MQLHCTGQNIKSREHPSVRPPVCPASVDKIVTLFMDRFSSDFEDSLPYHTDEKNLSSLIGSSIRACATINRLSLTVVQVDYCTND